jgi:hypothetical protein
MLPNRFAVAALAIGCLAAAMGGGYLATRHNAASEPAAAATLESALPEPAPVVPVQETEALVGDLPTAEAPPAPAPSAAARSNSNRGAGSPASRAPRAAAPAARRADPPPLDRTWPSSASAPAAPAVTTPASSAPPLTETLSETVRQNEPPPAPEPTFAELVVSANSVIGLELDETVSSETARVEDRVEARVVRDVRVGDEVAVPEGSQALGSVMFVERGGRLKARARLGIRFHTLVLADGTRLPITTETIFRDGDSPANASAAKIGGGAVAGAILGAIIGGAKGAAVGATAGAGGGTAAVMASEPRPATFPSGTEVTARIVSPVTVTVEK